MIEIVNVSKNWAIGKKGTLLVTIPEDMRFFRETTKGKVCIMGSATLKSFPNGAPLKNRVNIVLIDDEKKIDPAAIVAAEADRAEGRSTELIYVKSPAEAAERAKAYPKEDVFVIGGASVYRIMLPYCDTCLVTHNDLDDPEADTFYPDLTATGEWRLAEQGDPHAWEGITFRFCRYERV